MQEVSPFPLGLLVLILTTLLRIFGLADLQAPAAWYFSPPPERAVQSVQELQLVGMHTVAVMQDRADPKSIAEQCDVALAVPEARSEHRVLCEVPLGGLHHHRLRVVEPGSAHLFLPGRCPKQLSLPDKIFPRLVQAEPQRVRTQADVSALCGPAAGRLRR